MKHGLLLLLIFLAVASLSACIPAQLLEKPLMATLQAIPTQTAYPTQTAFPTYTPAPTKVVIVTPTNSKQDSSCKPITGLDYDNNSKIMIKLQSYVSDLPNVRSVSFVIPEKVYPNTDSQLYYVNYISESSGNLYSMRFLVYVNELGWKKGTFSIDGQCWIDYPHN
jgi:hypothetical protein